VFSRTPFNNQQILDLGDDRPATIVTIDKEGQPITFTAVHLRAYGLRWVPPMQIPQAINERTTLQNRQAEILLETLAQEEGIIIIGCDCNSKETSSSYRILQSEMRNASHSNGRRLFYSPQPGTQMDLNIDHIDYIFYRGNIRPIGTFTLNNTGGSDHQPLLAQFALP
jgi:endonuclease/exonuclease/phosphatase (EEP) superfamily protein YafD